MPRRAGVPLTVPNPAIFEDEGAREMVADQCLDMQTFYAALPEPHHIIAEEGSWIIVREVPHTALPWDVPLYSIWRARRVIRQRTFKLGHARSSRVAWPLMLAEIQTPGGDLVLYPTEYVVTDIAKWLELLDEGVTVNFLGAGEPGELADQVFYMQAHGLARRDALLLLLPQLTDSRFAYLTLDVGDA